MNKAIWIILIFFILLVYHGNTMSYNLSASEVKYKSYMEYLEGDLTEEKATFIMKEEKKYEDAFAMIDRIDSMLGNEEISENEAENMKRPYECITAYYSVFEKVEKQYDYIEEHQEAVFVYDTGYNFLFGKNDKHIKNFILELLIVLILCFSGVEAVEYTKGCDRFLFATPKGRSALRKNKYVVCGLITMALVAAVTLVRIKIISEYVGFSQILSSVNSLPILHGAPGWLPIIGALMIGFLLAYLAVLLIFFIIAVLSRVTKNTVYTLLISGLLLVLPMVIFF